MLQVAQDRKSAVNKLKAFVNTKKQWDGFCEYLDIVISEQHKKLEQSDNIVSIHQAQGAIKILRQLKYLREEASD